MFRLCLLVLGAVAVYGQANVCDLTRVSVQPDFKPELWRGAWFESRFYPRRNYDASSYYEDYVYEVTPITGTLDMQIKEKTRDNRAATCRVANDQRRYYEANGKYYYYKSQTGQTNVKSWIVETDYNTYAIEFLCYDVRGSTCYDSEVSLWTRTPGNSNPSIKAAVRARFLALRASRELGCIKLAGVKEINHNYRPDALYKGGCTDLPITGVSTIHPGISTFPGYNYFMDPALVTAQKEQLIALKEKLVHEKEVLDLEAEKLRLIVAILRRGGRIPDGIRH